MEQSGNLFDWFRVRVEDARRSVGIRLSVDGETYLTALLVERARTDRPCEPETTLAQIHLRAAHASPSDQVRAYREIGDRALHTLGLFQESLERSIVGARYYGDMGAAAYIRVDQVYKRWFQDAFGEVFAEMATRFGDAVAILREIRRMSEGEPDVVDRLYERWLATGDPEIAERLHGMGLLLPPRLPDA